MRTATLRRWPPTLYIGALALFATGCDATTAPAPADGVFVLRTVGMQSLPAVTSVVLDTEFSVLADTIVLSADGSGEWMTTTARRNLGTDARDTTRTEKRFTHRRRGGSVRATDITCEPLCTVLPDEAEFQLDGDWLTRGLGPAAERYERIAPSGAR